MSKIRQVFAHYQREDSSPGGFKYCPLCATPLAPAQIGHVKRVACPSCGFVQHRNPAPRVSVLVVEGVRVLLGRCGGHPGKGAWSLPEMGFAEDVEAIRLYVEDGYVGLPVDPDYSTPRSQDKRGQ